MNELSQDKQATTAPPSFWARYHKPLIFALLVSIMVFGWWQLRDTLTLAGLSEKEAQLRAFQRDHPVLVYGAAFLVYAVVTGLNLPGAAVLSLLYGWYFKLLRGVILVSFASTTGATIAFLLSRYLFRDAVQRKFGERLSAFNQALEREGPFYLFTLRLIPAVPFFVINAVMGLTPIRTWTFWWVSQLGMLPGTVVYVYAGSSVPDLHVLAESGLNAVFTPKQMIQIFVAFALLGIFPLAVRKLMKMLPGMPSPPAADDVDR